MGELYANKNSHLIPNLFKLNSCCGSEQNRTSPCLHGACILVIDTRQINDTLFQMIITE